MFRTLKRINYRYWRLRLREAYEEHLKWFRMELNTLKKAEAKGKAKEKTAIAKNLISQNIDINTYIDLVCLLQKLNA